MGFFRSLFPLCMSSFMPLHTEHESWAQRKKERKFPDAAEYGNAYETRRIDCERWKVPQSNEEKNPRMKIAGFFYAKRGKKYFDSNDQIVNINCFEKNIHGFSGKIDAFYDQNLLL